MTRPRRPNRGAGPSLTTLPSGIVWDKLLTLSELTSMTKYLVYMKGLTVYRPLHPVQLHQRNLLAGAVPRPVGLNMSSMKKTSGARIGVEWEKCPLKGRPSRPPW